LPLTRQNLAVAAGAIVGLRRFRLTKGANPGGGANFALCQPNPVGAASRQSAAVSARARRICAKSEIVPSGWFDIPNPPRGPAAAHLWTVKPPGTFEAFVDALVEAGPYFDKGFDLVCHGRKAGWQESC